MILRIFKMAPRLNRVFRSAYFHVAITRNFEYFQCFNFETIFLKNQNSFYKTGVPFIVESTMIKSATFSAQQNCPVKS